MNSNYQNPVNIGNPEEYTVLALAEKISNLLSIELKTVESMLPIDDPKKRCPDISKAKEILHWQPSTNLEEGLKKSIQWFEDVLDLS